MTTLTIFSQDLARLDEACGTSKSQMFNCKPREVAAGLFGYAFDGFFHCLVRYNEDGTISEWMDSFHDETAERAPTFVYADRDAWIARARADVGLGA